MRKVKNGDSLLEWADDFIGVALKIVATVFALFSLLLLVKGLIIIYDCDYMGFWEMYFMTEVEYDLEILKNNTLFIESYDGYTISALAMKGMILSLIMFVMSRFWGATTRIKHIYRHCFGKDFKFEF